MTITVKKRQKSKPKYYVYYNDWTGEILSVGTTLRKDTPAPVLETEDGAAARILQGKASSDQYIVSSDRHHKERLVEKSHFLQLRKQEDNLFLLPNQPMQHWDIRATLYKENSVIVFEVNNEIISRLISHNMQREIILDSSVIFEFYLIKNNEPDFLAKTISIDAKTLINHRKISFSILDILPVIRLDDISILTRRHLENYYFEILDGKFIDTSDSESEQKQNWQLVQADIDAHLELTQHENIVSVSSVVTADQLTDAGLYDRRMCFYLVGDSPDNYMAKMEIDVTRLRMGQTQKFAVDFNIMESNIMFHNPALRVNKRIIE